MLNIYNVNSLVHWEERDIKLRDDFIRFFSDEVANFLRSANPARSMRRVEAPTLRSSGSSNSNAPSPPIAATIITLPPLNRSAG